MPRANRLPTKKENSLCLLSNSHSFQITQGNLKKAVERAIDEDGLQCQRIFEHQKHWVTSASNRKGLLKETVNHKRVYRIMKKNNLVLRRYTGRPVRSRDGSIQMIRSSLRCCPDALEIFSVRYKLRLVTPVLVLKALSVLS